MSSNEREEKIYGAIDTEDHITFNGFCKKINSKEQYKINVYIDGILESTLDANKHIKSIESTYDMYDTNGFCFTYKIDENLIGEKHKIEFKTQDDEQLLKSPNQTINESLEKYNEVMFLRSLDEDIDTEKIRNLYEKDSISFLITAENVTNKNYLDYISSIKGKLKKYKINLFYINKKEKDLISKEFQTFNFIQTKHINDIMMSTEVFINTGDKINLNTTNYLQKHSRMIVNSFAYPYSNPLNILNISLKEFDLELKNEAIFNHPERFNVNKEVINLNEGLIHKFYYQEILNKNNINYIIDIDSNAFKFEGFENIELCLNYPEYKKSKIDFNRIRKFEI